MQRYARPKSRRAALDFDDLIAQTASLLATRRIRGVGAVQARRAARPHPGRRSAGHESAQWQVVARWRTSSSPVAAPATAVRTIFAVGDEKQSIYSASRARRPRCSRTWASASQRRPRKPASRWRRIPLDSFVPHGRSRCSAPSIDVFADPRGARRGGRCGGPIHHDGANASVTPGWSRSGRPRNTRRRTHADAWSPLDRERHAVARDRAGDPHRRHHQALARQQGEARRPKGGRSRRATS